jgi:hypothetical protein
VADAAGRISMPRLTFKHKHGKTEAPGTSPRAWKSAPNTGYGTLYTIKRRNVNLFATEYFSRRKSGFRARLAQVFEVYGLINSDRDEGNFSSNEQWSIRVNRPRNQLKRGFPIAYLLQPCRTPNYHLVAIFGDSVRKLPATNCGAPTHVDRTLR